MREPERAGVAWAWSLVHLVPSLKWHYAHYRDTEPQRLCFARSTRKDPYACAQQPPK